MSFSASALTAFARTMMFRPLRYAEVSSISFDTSTPITRLAPRRSAGITGTLLVHPPSTRSRPSIATGGRSPGTALLALTARRRGPSRMMTSSARLMSVATAANGILVWSMGTSSRMPLMLCSKCWALIQEVLAIENE